MVRINGLEVERNGNTVIIHAEDHEGTDKVEALNLALHVMKIVRANNETAIAKGISFITNHRYFIETSSGSILSRSEALQAVRFMQPRLRFS